MTSSIICGCSLDVLPTLDADSIDSIVCDPPYGLSSDTAESVANRARRALHKIMLPDLDQVEPDLAKQIDLGCVPLDGSPLTRRKLAAIGVEAWIGVPKGAVDLDDERIVDEKIDARCVPAVAAANANLPPELHAAQGEFLGHYVLDARDAIDSSAGDVVRSSVCQPSASGIRVSVVPTLLPGRHCPLTRFLLGESSGRRNDVRRRDDATSETEAAAGVVAGAGAVHSLVLGLDVTGGSLELTTAHVTSQGDTCCHGRGAKLVRTLPRACGLPTEAEAVCVRVVRNTADGACAHMVLWVRRGAVEAFGTSITTGGFMGKAWDHGVPGESFWREALRVAKPGAHLLAFGGTRTYHRLACAIEDAGWEIRDCIMWVHSQGFPKSLDVSKAIDKAAGAEREVVGKYIHPATGKVHADFRTDSDRSAFGSFEMCEDTRTVTAPATEAARQWSGWGTALKPAWEPIIVARKPLVGTVAANVLRYGTGAVNVDGCRVETGESIPAHHGTNGAAGRTMGSRREYVPGSAGTVFNNTGRWPANLIHDGSDEVVGLFPEGSFNKPVQRGSAAPTGLYEGGIGKAGAGTVRAAFGDTGSAARFFYCAKASKADREEGNDHPTVKPTALMRYLCRLVTPPGGKILDPFCGSGSTGKAALAEGFQFVGIEREPKYAEIASRRVAASNT